MNVEEIARIVHEANRGYCLANGDTFQQPWEQTPEHTKKSVIDGVMFIINNPGAPPSASHDNWLKFKEEEGGWSYGPIKDLDKKTHPCFLPYNDLPVEQKAKDYIFGSIVRSLIPYLTSSPATVDRGIASIDEQGVIHFTGDDGKRYADLSNVKAKPL